MNSKYSDTLRALPMVAKVLGRNLGVVVRVGGEAAMTDGKVITLPSLPIPADGNEPGLRRLQRLSWGYLHHEACHVRHTDFDADRTRGGLATPFEHGLQNIIEDIRVEHAQGLVYPGARDALIAVGEELISDGACGASLPGDHPAAILSNYVQYQLRANYLEQPAYTPLANDTELALFAAFDEGVRIRLDGLMSTVDRLSSTGDAIHLAARIVAMLDDEAKRAAAPNPVPDSNGDESESASPRGVPTRAAGLEAITAALAADDSVVGAEHGAAIAAALNAEAEQQRTVNGNGLGAADASDTEFTLDPKGIRLADVEGTTGQLRLRLSGRLQAERDRFCRRVTSGHRLNGARLHEALFGEARIFLARDAEQVNDTAVQLLLDRSGSMERDDRIVIAREAMLAIGLALSAIQGVSLGAAAFPSLGVCTPMGGMPRRTAERYALKAEGGTPLTEALVWCGSELLAVPEARRILIVLTDGEPDNVATAQHALRALRGQRIEVYGIGIQCAIGHLFAKSVRINTLSELPSSLFGLVERAMLAA